MQIGREGKRRMEAQVTWLEERRFVGHASSGHAMVLDGGQEKRAPSPMELVLIGTLGCTAYDVVNILEKKRQAVTGVEVTAQACRAEEPPQVFTEIEITYVVRGQGISVKAVEDAIRLSKSKYCSATNMLETTARITTSYRIEEA
jgi:putative redox protein